MSIIKIVDGAIELNNRTRSSRFNAFRLNVAINNALQSFISVRMDEYKQKRSNSFFEALQRIKDDLRTLVVIDEAVPFTAGVITLPADYDHELGVEVKINGRWKYSTPATLSENQAVIDNYHFRPSELRPIHFIAGNQITVRLGEAVSTQARLYYLKRYTTPRVSDTVITNATALTPGLTYGVNSQSGIVYNSVAYGYGDIFTAGAVTAFTGSGTLIECVDTELPRHTHVELTKMIADELAGIVENYQRKISQKQEVKST